MDKSFKERRKHVRIYRNFMMSYHEKGKLVIKHNVSQVNNVSKGGVSFSSTHPLKEGVVIVVGLKTPFIAESIKLEGVVLECREKIPSIIYEVRLKFQEISHHAMAMLEKIEEYSKS